MENSDTAAFHARLRGTFYGILQWRDLDVLWERVKSGQWYFYQVGETMPTQALNGDGLAVRIDALNTLLRHDHDCKVCGIVYADHVEQPALIKVYDPNTLGSSCSHSATPPRWILSTEPPAHIENQIPTPNNRKRWWQLFSS